MSEDIKKNKIFNSRALAAVAAALLCIPVSIIGLGKGSGHYYLAATIIIILSMIPFFIKFESGRVKTEELVILAVIIAMGVASRAVFAFLPGFKPMAAFIIIAGIVFGAEAGFLTGALSMFVSNFIFGQGSWTPWQMFAYGICGLLTGLLFRTGILKKNRIFLGIYGFLVVFFIVGPLLDTSSLFVLTSEGTDILGIYLAGMPMNASQGAAVGVTLFLISKGMFEKLDRIKIKYGL